MSPKTNIREVVASSDVRCFRWTKIDRHIKRRQHPQENFSKNILIICWGKRKDQSNVDSGLRYSLRSPLLLCSGFQLLWSHLQHLFLAKVLWPEVSRVHLATFHPRPTPGPQALINLSSRFRMMVQKSDHTSAVSLKSKVFRKKELKVATDFDFRLWNTWLSGNIRVTWAYCWLFNRFKKKWWSTNPQFWLT